MSRTVRALIHTRKEFKAAVLRQTGSGYELLAYGDRRAELPAADTTVAGFDSGRVAFYRIKVPPVKDEQMHSLIRMQAETLLPLPIEQMDIAWRRGGLDEGKIPVTITAARSVQLERFFQEVQDYQPHRIFLDCEALVKAWQVFYGGGSQSAVIIYIGAVSSRICLVQNGRLSHALTLDVGREVLTCPQPEQTNLQRFTHDLQNSLQLLDIDQEPPVPVYLLCPDLHTFQNLTGYLAQAQLNVEAALPNRDLLTASAPFSSQNFYEYLVPIGLALMALEAESDELKLFRRLLPEKDPHEKIHFLPSLKLSAALAGLMLILFALCSYARLSSLEGSLNQVADPNIDLGDLQIEQRIKKNVAQERLDLISLIQQISSSAPRGVELDKFTYQKGRPITVDGHASGRDQQELLLSFRAALLKKPQFKTVIIQNQRLNTRNNQTTFTIKFELR